MNDGGSIKPVWWVFTAKINNDNGNVVVILDEYHSEAVTARTATNDVQYVFPAFTKDQITATLTSFRGDGMYGHIVREGNMGRRFHAEIDRVQRELAADRENATVFMGRNSEFKPQYVEKFWFLARLYATLAACRSAGAYNNFYGGGREGDGYNLREEIMRHHLDGPTFTDEYYSDYYY